MSIDGTCFQEWDEEEWHIYDIKEGSLCKEAEPSYAPGGGTRWAVLETNPAPLCTGCKNKMENDNG